jgi:hypothetical protein
VSPSWARYLSIVVALSNAIVVVFSAVIRAVVAQVGA